MTLGRARKPWLVTVAAILMLALPTAGASAATRIQTVASGLNNPNGIARATPLPGFYVTDHNQCRVKLFTPGSNLDTGTLAADAGLTCVTASTEYDGSTDAAGSNLNEDFCCLARAGLDYVIADGWRVQIVQGTNQGNHRIRTIAGTDVKPTPPCARPIAATTNGMTTTNGLTAQLCPIAGLAGDNDRVLIVDDSSRPEGPVVYQIDYSNTTALGPTSATIHRVAGGGCNGPPATPAEVCLGNPLQNTHSFGIEYDGAGGFYLADTGRHIIRHFTTTDFDTATSSIVAGINGTPGSNDGPATAAGLTAPFDVALSPLDGALFISDAGNCRVRRVLNGIVDTIAGSACTGSLGDGGLATSAVLTAGRLAPSASGLYVADPIRGVVRLVDMTSVVSGPPAYTQSESADFTIASLDTADHILCSIDSDNNYSACDTQPHTVSKPEGSHTLYAATGSAPGFLFDPTPAKWTWTVDHSPPDAFLITDPAEGATGVTTVPTITWTAANDTYSGVDHYELTVGGVRNGGDVGCCALDVAAPLGEGQHNITVRAVDKAGNYTDTATRTFDVGSLPVASFSIAPNPVLAGGTVTFTSTATDADGPIARYEWDLDGDGTYETDSGANASASRAYPTAGSLTIAHRVTDSAGRAAETTGRLTVSAAAVIPQQFGMTVNNGAQYTNDPNVTLNAVFPSTITSILASNDGGFLVPASFAPAKEIKWKLDSSGPERLPKTVYMRFLTGVFTSETYTDDIILDETPPKVSSASVASATSSAARAAKTKKYTLKLKASDSNSGVAGVQITANKKKAGKLLKYKTKLSVKASSSKLYVRAKDKAGNYSKWRAASRKRGG